MKRTTTLAHICAAVLVGACSEQPAPKPLAKTVPALEMKKEAAPPPKAASVSTPQEKSELQGKIASELAQIDGQLKELRQQAEKVEKEKRVEIGKAIDELELKAQQAARRVDELKSAGEQAWEDLRRGADEALAEAKKAYEKARERF